MLYSPGPLAAQLSYFHLYTEALEEEISVTNAEGRAMNFTGKQRFHHCFMGDFDGIQRSLLLVYQTDEDLGSTL